MTHEYDDDWHAKRRHDAHHTEPVYRCRYCSELIRGKTHNDRGQLIYAARANWGLEAERTMAHIPHRFGLFYRAGLLAEVERRGVET